MREGLQGNRDKRVCDGHRSQGAGELKAHPRGSLGIGGEFGFQKRGAEGLAVEVAKSKSRGFCKPVCLV